MGRITWSDEMVDCLDSMWKKNNSMSEIASAVDKISSSTITRSSVAGKINRLGLTKRDNPTPS